MADMLIPIVGIAFALGFTSRKWLALAAAALLTGVLVLAGAFDDGEGIAAYGLLSTLFMCLAGVGLLISIGVQRLGAKPLPE